MKFVNGELQVVMVGVEPVENVVDIFRFDEEEGVVNVTRVELDLSASYQFINHALHDLHVSTVCRKRG